MWPHKLLGEGHFAAVLRKQGTCAPAASAPEKSALPPLWSSFAKELGICLPEGKAIRFGQSLYWAAPDTPSLSGLKVLRPGLELGIAKKDRFEPAHALALWLRDCKNTIDLSADDPLTDAYLRGNVIPGNAKGWCLIRIGGYSIGWGKGDGTQIKNHYPKGSRKMG